jgi:hypothetical protein
MAKVGKNYPRLRLHENYRYKYQFDKCGIAISYERKVYYIGGDVRNFLFEFFEGNHDGIVDFIEGCNLNDVAVRDIDDSGNCYAYTEDGDEGYHVEKFEYGARHYRIVSDCWWKHCECTRNRTFLFVLNKLTGLGHTSYYQEGRFV